MIKRRFSEKIFDNNYIVLVGENEECDRWLSKSIKDYQFGHLEGCYACALFHDAESRHTIIFFSRKAWDDKEYVHDTIAHEALHAAVRSLDVHGVKFEVDNHEIYAYTVGWIAREIYKLRNAKKKKDRATKN